nr:pilus assembly protein PilP [Nitrospiraceae bacterium]
MATRTSIAACVIVMIMVAGLAGCGDKKAGQPKPAVQPPKTAAPQAQAPQEEKIEKLAYDYDAKGRRDPFQSLVDVAKAKPKRSPGKRPIENFDVDEIVLSAIVWDQKEYYALITLPDNKSYTIKRGMTLGLYGGKVVEITKDS